MYRKATLYSVLALGLIAFLWLIQVSFVRKNDLEKYRLFHVQNKEIASTNPLSSATQNRTGVRKEIWFTQEDHSRLQYRIESLSSTLTLLPTDDKLDIIENLQHIKCWMQDKLYMTGTTPMQQMRFFEADQGQYQYTTQQFLAEAVTLSLFRLPGHTFSCTLNSNTAFLTGLAQDVSFSVSGKTTQFHAERFKATLKPQTEEGL